MQERVTHKTSTILISTRGRLQTFRSLNEVPTDLRERLVESTSGPYSATLLIADESGRREIMRSLQGQPSAVESSWIRSVASRQHENKVALTGGAEIARPNDSDAISASHLRSQRLRHAAELALVGGIVLCLWLMVAWK